MSETIVMQRRNREASKIEFFNNFRWQTSNLSGIVVDKPHQAMSCHSNERLDKYTQRKTEIYNCEAGNGSEASEFLNVWML